MKLAYMKEIWHNNIQFNSIDGYIYKINWSKNITLQHMLTVY